MSKKWKEGWIYFRVHPKMYVHTEDMRTTMYSAQACQRDAEATVRAMTKFIREEFNVPDFAVNARYDFSSRRTRSRGGIKRAPGGKIMGYVSIQMNRYWRRDPFEAVEYTEYSQIARHPTIGSRRMTARLAQDATIAHELAHAVEWYFQYGCGLEKLKVAGDFAGGIQFRHHGRRWQYIYHVLREQFVNNSSTFVETYVEPEKKPTPTFQVRIRAVSPTGGTNIQRVVALYREMRTSGFVHDEKAIAAIMELLNVKRGNAKIYLAKAKART